LLIGERYAFASPSQAHFGESSCDSLRDVLRAELFVAAFCDRTYAQLEVDSDRKWNVMNMLLQTE
jgi:hypothetical protein